MNDLSQNELLSAYLDGELTAAEQAEMERLLAQSPAAGQLLDELRALRNMLQTLPQEKLTEDLSRQVLRVAERRMLTEEEPGAAENGSMPPMPLGRSLVRRFLNRRTMTWMALMATIAIMIRISERWQGVPPVADAERQVALARPAQPAASPAAPPSIQSSGNGSIKADQVASARPTLKVAHVGETVAVVRCNISSDAAQKGAFEKLLYANGVVWRQRPEPSRALGGQKEKAARDAKQLPSDRSLFWQSIATGEENLVEVEATAAQLDAMLAGLKAQPDLFGSFSVQRNTNAYGRARSAFVAGQEKRPSSQSLAENAPRAAAAPAKAEQHVERHLQRPSLAGPPARQRMLFVLHVVGADHPPIAAKARAETKIDAAKPGEQAAPPGNASKLQK
jgi:anti-sigma factor RsiW